MQELYDVRKEKNNKMMEDLNKTLDQFEKKYQTTRAVYDDLPIAKELKAKKIELQQCKIQLAVVRQKREELKQQEKLRNFFRKRREQLIIIRFAEAYVGYQNRLKNKLKIQEISENDSLTKQGNVL